MGMVLIYSWRAQEVQLKDKQVFQTNSSPPKVHLPDGSIAIHHLSQEIAHEWKQISTQKFIIECLHIFKPYKAKEEAF